MAQTMKLLTKIIKQAAKTALAGCVRPADRMLCSPVVEYQLFSQACRKEQLKGVERTHSQLTNGSYAVVGFSQFAPMFC